ncbi:MAG: pyruvate kinase [Patescibacteria group bacterium]
MIFIVLKIYKKTKIISTLGPASEDPQKIKKLIESGVNVFRFNMKHGTVEWHENAIEKVQKIANELEYSLGILIDLQGPEIRIQTKNGEELEIKEGQEIIFTHVFKNDNDLIRIPHKSFFDALEEGDKFSIDDGFIRFVVTKKETNRLTAGTLDDAIVKNNKGLNLVGKDIDLPSMIDDDIERLHLAVRKKVDYVALSFVRTKHDVIALKQEMKRKKINAQIVSKVESQKGLDNIEEIIDESDVVMIARGDLGIEVPMEQITYHQKQIINKCRLAHKPVIVATQMLQSMIEYPLPTRAEATDVANAVFDGTDAVMLSGETATGKYPLKAVEAMSKILAFNEEKAEVTKFNTIPTNATELIVRAAEDIAEHAFEPKTKFIVVFTETGYTAKVLSSFRPKIPIIAVTHNQKTVETLTLSYGVTPVKVKFPKSGRLISPDAVLQKIKELKLVHKGDNILLIHGQHWQKPGQTNAIVFLPVE